MSLILSSCQTPTAREVAEYVGRPPLLDSCIANDDGTCYRNGDLIEAVNMLCTDADEFITIQEHLEDMEYFKYKCKKFKRCK